MADDANNKRLAIIGISSILLVAMVVAVTIGVGFSENGESEDITGKSHKSTGEISASMKAIKSICQPADYKKTCEKSLEKSAGNTTDPKELIKAAFKIAQKKFAIHECRMKAIEDKAYYDLIAWVTGDISNAAHCEDALTEYPGTSSPMTAINTKFQQYNVIILEFLYLLQKQNY
ncbi:hypothetical protein JCGZ_23285 [Jatropha curcas]|uniref:Pectinesterase inhibitor domain-containing protein n=1 Tax=Jatropha curcas TaxID=180498 RepID=A0A067JHV3_JATCU|nr:hypothetical protein JCGZ_23285 [Jatropha curcas]